MKNNIKSILLILVLGIFTLTGCNKIDSKLFGTWEYRETGTEETLITVYTFNKDGTGSQIITVGENVSDRKYIYKTEKGTILITFDDDKEYQYEYSYRFDGKDLVLKDSFNEEITYNKK